jgi:hypothetical protein
MRRWSGLVLLLALAGCGTLSDGGSGIDALRAGQWELALQRFRQDRDTGADRAGAAPFLAAAAYLDPGAADPLGGALAELAAAEPWPAAGPARLALERMAAHLAATGCTRALLEEHPERVAAILERVPRTSRLQPLRERYEALAAHRLGSPGAGSRLRAAHARRPFDAEVAAALREHLVQAGDPGAALQLWKSLAPPLPGDDRLAARCRGPREALARGDRPGLARALAARGWLAEAAATYDRLAAAGAVSRGELRAFRRDHAAIRAVIRTLTRYHRDARANRSATARSRGRSLDDLLRELHDGVAAAGLVLGPDTAQLRRAVPFVVELEPFAVLGTDPRPPARPGEDGLVHLLARYGLVLDLVELFGVVDARLYHAVGLEQVQLEYAGRRVSTLVLTADETVVPGGIRYRLGAGGISGRAYPSRSGVLVVADLLRPSRRTLAYLRRQARKELPDPELPLPERDGARLCRLLQGWFDPDLDDAVAYRRLFALELAQTRAHELGHVYDFASLLPLGAHLDKVLHVLLTGLGSPARIEARFEEGAEHFALATGPDPWFAAHGSLQRLEIDPRAPGTILAAAAGSRPWESAYVEAARRLARAIDVCGPELSTADLRAIGAAGVERLALTWPLGPR